MLASLLLSILNIDPRAQRPSTAGPLVAVEALLVVADLAAEHAQVFEEALHVVVHVVGAVLVGVA